MTTVHTTPRILAIEHAAPMTVHRAAWLSLTPEERGLVTGGLLGFALGAVAALLTMSLRVGEISYLIAALTVSESEFSRFRPLVVAGTRYFFREVEGARRMLRTFLFVHFAVAVFAAADLLHALYGLL